MKEQGGGTMKKKKAFSLMEMTVVLFMTSIAITGACLYLYLTVESTNKAVREQRYIDEIESVRSDLLTILGHYDTSNVLFSVEQNEIVITKDETELDRVSMEKTFSDSSYEFLRGIVCSATQTEGSSMIQIDVSYLNLSPEVYPVVYAVKSASVVVE